MTPEEYVNRQTLLSLSVIVWVRRMAALYVAPFLVLAEWLALLELLFPEVQRRRLEAAELGREFFDAERSRQRPDLERADTWLDGYTFEDFILDMEPIRKQMSQADAPEEALGRFTSRIARVIENGGRQQIIHAVMNDTTAPGVVRGWARVATGRETCAWCLMLISRGPVYQDAEAAGLNLPTNAALDLFRPGGGNIDDYMQQWHENCDCKVVPVYSLTDWPGARAQKEAERLWKEATREAYRLIESGEARSNNLNKETQNAIRRMIYRGEVDLADFAFV